MLLVHSAPSPTPKNDLQAAFAMGAGTKTEVASAAARSALIGMAVVHSV
jgi:hypothetical protein